MKMLVDDVSNLLSLGDNFSSQMLMKVLGEDVSSLSLVTPLEEVLGEDFSTP